MTLFHLQWDFRKFEFGYLFYVFHLRAAFLEMRHGCLVFAASGLCASHFFLNCFYRMRRSWLMTNAALCTQSLASRGKRIIISLPCQSTKNHWWKLWQRIQILCNLHSAWMRLENYVSSRWCVFKLSCALQNFSLVLSPKAIYMYKKCWLIRVQSTVANSSASVFLWLNKKKEYLILTAFAC